MDLDEFTQYADHVINTEVPQPLLRDLNLGIIVIPHAQRDDGFYVLGHYSVNRLGRHIALFYGSFRAILRGQPRRVWEQRIRETIRHEFRHHVETLAGDRSLAIEDAKQRLRYEEVRSKDPKKDATENPLGQRIWRWLRGFFTGEL